MKKRILIMPDGNWLSHTTRPLEIAKKLREMGMEVLFASDGEYMKLPRKNGFEVLSTETIDPDRVLKCSRSGRANWYDYDLIKACVKAELDVYEKVNPDLVLGDFRLTLSTSCEISKIPYASLLNAAWTDYYSVRIKAPEHLSIPRVLGKNITNLLVPYIKKFIITYDSRPYNKFRRQNGLRPRKTIWDIWRGDLNLMVDIPEYGPTKNLPENFYYIGPIVWEPDLPPPEWLEKIDPDTFTIYFTMGSTGYPQFFEQAINIFGDTEYQCIMTTAGMVNLKNIPENFFVTDYAPGSMLMKKSDVVVCQGGNGTIYQAMQSGIPVIGIPTMHDQEFNLDRVTDLGFGIHLSELKFKPIHLEKAIEKVKIQTEFKKNADKLKDIVNRYNAPVTGARLLESF